MSEIRIEDIKMGKFIVIEGLDGTGKTTQTELLRDHFEKTGKKVRFISFPNYKGNGSALVRMYLRGDFGSDPDSVNAYAASMFFAADRYASYRCEGWGETLTDGDTAVIATRYTTANAYHQLAKLPENEWDAFLAWLWDFEFTKLALPRPDKVILLTMPPELSLGQVDSRVSVTGEKKDIHECDRNYMIRCRRAADYAAVKLGWATVECAENGRVLPREVIFEKILAKVAPFIVDTKETQNY